MKEAGERDGYGGEMRGRFDGGLATARGAEKERWCSFWNGRTREEKKWHLISIHRYSSMLL